jgi:hypothetical protein
MVEIKKPEGPPKFCGDYIQADFDMALEGGLTFYENSDRRPQAIIGGQDLGVVSPTQGSGK